MAEHLLLIDCSHFAYRAYYSMPAMRRESDGEPTGAVLGFMGMVWRLLGAAQADQPTLAAAVFDAPGPTFRHKLFPAYKSNRGEDRKLNLSKQIPLMHPVAEVLGLRPVELKGYEADDVIATLATRAFDAGIRTTIVSTDKDFAQLVCDGAIEIVDPMASRRDKNPRKLRADVVEKFGVDPAFVPDVQALAGDTADGIPGIKGIGIERAAALVRRFETLEGVLKNADRCPRSQERINLKRYADDARLYLKLTTLRRNAPVKVSWEQLRLRPIIRGDLEKVVKRLDPSANITQLFGLDRQNIRTVHRMPDPLDWWREELACQGQRLPEIPQCGFYKRRMAPAPAPWVPARIYRDPFVDPVSGKDTGVDLLMCEVNGKPRDPYEEFTRLAMQPIKESDFRFMTADLAHAKAHRPGDPKATPGKSIDITKLPAPHNPRRRR